MARKKKTIEQTAEQTPAMPTNDTKGSVNDAPSGGVAQVSSNAENTGKQADSTSEQDTRTCQTIERENNPLESSQSVSDCAIETDSQLQQSETGESGRDSVATTTYRTIDAVIPSHGRGRLFPAKPGEHRNPAGRQPAGLVIKEWYNVMASSKWTAKRVVAAWKDEEAPASKRAAAYQMMQTMGLVDVADLSSVVDGTESLKSAQRKGLPTHAIKKMKVRTRTDKDGNETVEREIELHPDKSGEAMDRIADRTVGKPNQAILTASVNLDPQVRAQQAVDLARSLLGLQ